MKYFFAFKKKNVVIGMILSITAIIFLFTCCRFSGSKLSEKHGKLHKNIAISYPSSIQQTLSSITKDNSVYRIELVDDNTLMIIAHDNSKIVQPIVSFININNSSLINQFELEYIPDKAYQDDKYIPVEASQDDNYYNIDSHSISAQSFDNYEVIYLDDTALILDNNYDIIERVTLSDIQQSMRDIIGIDISIIYTVLPECKKVLYLYPANIEDYNNYQEEYLTYEWRLTDYSLNDYEVIRTSQNSKFFHTPYITPSRDCKKIFYSGSTAEGYDFSTNQAIEYPDIYSDNMIVTDDNIVFLSLSDMPFDDEIHVCDYNGQLISSNIEQKNNLMAYKKPPTSWYCNSSDINYISDSRRQYNKASCNSNVMYIPAYEFNPYVSSINDYVIMGYNYITNTIDNYFTIKEYPHDLVVLEDNSLAIYYDNDNRLHTLYLD